MAQDEDKSTVKQEDETRNELAVGVKLPEFTLKNPADWLLEADDQFKLAGITKEETQYYHILSRLPSTVMQECQDVVPVYVAGTLEQLKTALLTRYTLSTEERIKKQLDGIHFRCTELPSAFFRRLWTTANDVLLYGVVLQRFRERLPPNISYTITPLISKLYTQYTANNERPTEDESIMLDVADTIQPLPSVSITGNSHAHLHLTNEKIPKLSKRKGNRR